MLSFSTFQRFRPSFHRSFHPTIRLVAIVAIGVTGFQAPILAQQPTKPTRVRYIPNKKRPLPRRTESAGTRGCAVDSQPIQVNLLVPSKDMLPQTQSAHPTFSWHVTNPKQAELALQFSLVEPGQARPIYQQQVTNRQTGVMQLTLPQPLPGLEVGKQYRWAISWGCNARRPSEQMHQRAWIERSPLTDRQTQQLHQAQTDHDRVLVYAQSGIWYDAIGLAANPTDSKMREYWQTLLKDGGLTHIETRDDVAVRAQ
jgi:Domain of Unknown Function (DUF928)